MPPSTIQRHQRLLTILGVVFVILFLLVYLMPSGGRSYLALREELTQVRAEIDQIKSQNQELRDEILHLKEDSSYVTDIARKRLGMLKKNEIVFEEAQKKDPKDKEKEKE